MSTNTDDNKNDNENFIDCHDINNDNIHDEKEEPIEINNNPSLCIPRVFKDISVPSIANVFQNKLKFGVIKKINIIPNINDKNFKKVFIHFDFWYDSENINNIKQKILNGTTIKVIYDMPWFWKCCLNRYPTKNDNYHNAIVNTKKIKHKNKTQK